MKKKIIEKKRERERGKKERSMVQNSVWKVARINACALTTAYDPSFSPRLSTPLAWGARRVQWPHAPPFEGRLAPRQSIQKRKKGKEKEKKEKKPI